MTKTKISLGVIAVTVLTVATLFLLPLPQKITVKTDVAVRGNLQETLLLEGVVVYEGQTPLISLQNGQIQRVLVNQGDSVEKGQLLFLLDSGEEQIAMKQITAERKRLEGYEAVWAPLMAAQQAELTREEAALKKSIAMKQVRAEANGIVGMVCCQEGEAVTQGTMLGSLHGEEIRIEAFVTQEECQQLIPGCEAEILNERGEMIGWARMERTGMPEIDPETGIMGCRIWFTVGEEWSPGKRVTLEVTGRVWQDEVLVPVEALDENGRIWIVEDGKAKPLQAPEGKRNGDFITLPGELEGKPVILNPDEYGLIPGGAVRREEA